ncbi:MAG: magnesium/cobalt transporter CorA [Firmicutes bacterium]|nr:magnesium/cobalt transporter CorA [Bacillota bacterium]
MPEAIKRKRKKRSQKTGLEPGALVHIGEKRAGATRISVTDYDEKHIDEKVLGTVEECFVLKDKPTVTWINVDSAQDVDVVEKLGNCYGIHPLVLEDILNTDQRPKLEDYGDYLYIVIKMLYYRNCRKGIIAEQISLILGPNFLISFQEGIEGDIFDPIRERLRVGNSRIRKMGADYLAYALVDSVVDSYFGILEGLGDDIEALEDELVTNPDRETLHTIHDLKREMIYLRRSVWPLREVINSMGRGESLLIHESTKLFLRDVYDHTIQVIDTVETYRDMLSGMLDIYLSSVSNRLNEVVKVLTIISTIFIPLTFLVGVYGMNFKYMPEISSPYGYPAVWIVMVLVAIGMLIYFRRRKWL